MAHAIVTFLDTAGPGGANLQRMAYSLTFFGDDVSAAIAQGKRIDIEVTVSNTFLISELRAALLSAVQAQAALLGLTVSSTDILGFELNRVAFWDSTGLASVQSLSPWAMYRYGLGITSTAGAVSQWNDDTVNGRHLKQSIAGSQPTLQADGSILFDGVGDFLRTDAATLNQPETVYLLFKQVTWAGTRYILDGVGDNTGAIEQFGTTPNILAAAPASSSQNSNLPLGTYGVAWAVFNGASSSIQVNNTAPTTFNCGANNMGGLTIGGAGASGGFSANIQVKEAIVFNSGHDAATKSIVISYLAGVGGISI